MIEIKGLKKSFGAKNVLGGVSLSIPSGSVFGLVGINGAGKSTLLRLIAGVLRADEGKILADGEEIFENEKKKREFFFLPDVFPRILQKQFPGGGRHQWRFAAVKQLYSQFFLQPADMLCKRWL